MLWNGKKNWKKNKVLGISRQPSAIQIMIDQEQPENVDYVYFNYLSNMLTKDARCIREIKSRIATAGAAFNQNNNFFVSKLD
jgi:hypothetical protein